VAAAGAALPGTCAAENSNKCCQPQNGQEATKPAASPAPKGSPAETSREEHGSSLALQPVPGVQRDRGECPDLPKPTDPMSGTQPGAAARAQHRTQPVMLHSPVTPFLGLSAAQPSTHWDAGVRTRARAAKELQLQWQEAEGRGERRGAVLPSHLAPVLCTSEAAPRVLCSFLGPSLQEAH